MLSLYLRTFIIIKCYAPISINSLNAAPAEGVVHCTPEPVDARTCPDVPVPPPAVNEPESVAPDKVTPAIVVTVAPDAIDVEPSVGAEYEDTVAQDETEPFVVRYLPLLPVCEGTT